MTLLDIPDEFVLKRLDGEIRYDFGLAVFSADDKLRFQLDGVTTSWMGADDDFIKRIRFDNLNRCLRHDHLLKEIEIKNTLDEAVGYLEGEKYSKAITLFDKVIYYDENYGPALLFKSHALFGQGHFIKAFRYYKRAIKADGNLKDIDYHKLLLKKSSEERDSFPKIKLQIFTGDEHFAHGNYLKAIESYDNALANPSKFKSKILYKLLNKKATALFKLKMFDEALKCFEKSIEVRKNDYAIYMKGFCRYSLGLDMDDEFKGPLEITKSQHLYRALILNESRLYGDAIKCVDDLLANHFAADKIYFIALSCKISAMQSLGIDAGREKYLLERL
ncbi:MAG: hypothetical protein IJL02_05925 [Methanobrevibacter sp.]|uniref:tetratricopeptide repeat protein n=1 Tax=Methanobrevibacter sp. TaxID=66852 RepID=UPI0025DBD8F1|nr:hypothetical protein [Methanobrevibacter sp.]MBQ6099385.1 hypothetical protein [Methanobrevibacter sp.]